MAEEIVEEVFLQLHSKWAEVNEPRAWLFRSVRNRAFNHLRKSRRETLNTDNENTALSDSLTETPDELIERMETVAELRKLVSQLPEKDRRLVHLRLKISNTATSVSERG